MDDQLLRDLHSAITRLAEAVDHQPRLAITLRRLADDLPTPRAAVPRVPLPRNPAAIQPLLWRALSDGLFDAQHFDRAMVARSRAARLLAARASSQPDAA